MSKRLASILVLLAGLSIFANPAIAIDLNKLLDLGDKLVKMSSEVSTEEEVKIGSNLVSGLLGAAPLVKDEKLQRYVNDVGYWIASRSSRPDLPWSFGVIDSDGVNAFAAPGGYVVITLGLYNLLENEAQLAAVLAHEISHVVEKHHLQALNKVLKREFWSGLAVAAVKDDEDREALGMVVNSGVQLYATGLDRDFEYDADLRGVVLSARAGYDPFALLDVLTTIDSISPDAAELTVLLNTHPPTGERLDRLANAMDGRLDYYAGGQSNADRFHQVSAIP
ncbi:MAG: M48 family metalloprotease [Gammaproteobacteria bacterium]|nr:MAG: peptidase M48 [Gammaproteobacteria bacterium]UCH41557.1 MAG: M48 family metalloprotease [Gammaproteobacteria bacterium]